MTDLNFVALDLKPVAMANINAKFTGATSGFSFYNSTGIPVYVSGRNGIVIKVDPCYDTSNIGRFTVRQNITFNKSENLRLPTEQINDDIISLFYDMYSMSDNTLANKRSMHYDSVIELRAIKEYGNTIYLRNLDLSITIDENIYDSFHPYTQKLSMDRIKSRIKDEKTSTTDVSFRFVDNEKLFTTMFTKIGNRVVAVNPIYDYSCESGLYTIYNKVVGKLTKKNDAKIFHSRIEQHGLNSKTKLEPIFFNTYEEALHYNGAAEVDRMKYEQSMAKLRNTEVELRNLSLELERQRKVEDERIEEIKRTHQKEALRDKSLVSDMELRLKKEQLKLAELEHNHKVEMMKMKEEYEKKSYQKKNTSDFLKAVPVIIGGIAAVAGCIYGSSKK